jgi:hypothetical protein
MIPAPLQKHVRRRPERLNRRGSHDTICHVHKSARHGTLGTRTLQQVIGIKVGLCECNSRSLDTRQQGGVLAGIVSPFAPVVCCQVILLVYQVLIGLVDIIDAPADGVLDVEVDAVCGSWSAEGSWLGE